MKEMLARGARRHASARRHELPTLRTMLNGKEWPQMRQNKFVRRDTIG